MIPNGTYGNAFVKATDNEIIVGYVKTEQNVDKLVVLADKKGTHSLSNKLDNVAEEDLKKVINEISIDEILKSASLEIKNIHNRLKSADVLTYVNGNTISYVTKNGNVFAKIEDGVFKVTVPKGSIPLPSTYLDPSFITNHINKFKQEGASFIVVKSWIEEGRFPAFPPRKFVGLKSDMDRVISRYKQNGDWKILRDELNLGAETNLANEEIYYVKVNSNDNRFQFDMPNGNEAGAIVGEWVPSGTTKNGITEAALIGCETCIHDNKIETLLQFFGNEKWEKIK